MKDQNCQSPHRTHSVSLALIGSHFGPHLQIDLAIGKDYDRLMSEMAKCFLLAMGWN
jgi:hypothetical protein